MANILIVDDQPFGREISKDIILGLGHDATAASTGAEAFKLARESAFDLALVDIYLEGENGLEVCRQLVRLQPDVPVIIMTSSPTLEAVVQSLRQGAYDFLVKPLNADVVRAALNRALERRGLIEEKNLLIRHLVDSNRVLRSFQNITLTTSAAQSPRTVLGKALRGIMEVTGASGSAILIKDGNLKLPFPYRQGPAKDSGPQTADLEAIHEAITCGGGHLLLPGSDRNAMRLVYGGPLMAMPLSLGLETTGVIVLWRGSGGAPFRTADLSVVNDILRAFGSLLNARLRQRDLQEENRRLTRRVSLSSSKIREVKSQLDSLVTEVRKERTRSSEALQRLEMINRLGQELSGLVDIENHIHKVLELCQQSLKARIISLMLFDKESDCLYIKHAIGLPEEVAPRAKVKPGEGISGWVFAHNEPLFISDVEADARFRKVSINQYETTSLISAPVRSKGKPIGVLNVNNKVDGTMFTLQDLDLLVFVSAEVGVAIENTSLYESTQNSYFETIRALVRVLEAKDETTKGHSERVTTVSLAIGRNLGLSPQSLEVLKRSGILHDLGKVAVDLSILRKEGKLTEEEYQTIKRHPLVAADIIKPMKHMEDVQRCIRQHHERQDGRGYPHGITDSCLEARILAVADAFDAMTSWRPYRSPMSKDEALTELQKCAGSQFDPAIVRTLVGMVENGDFSLAENVAGQADAG